MSLVSVSMLCIKPALGIQTCLEQVLHLMPLSIAYYRIKVSFKFNGKQSLSDIICRMP
jgi:hypothetical protein